MTPQREDALARLACAFAGATWGIYWLPLRGLAEAGLTGMWAIVPFFLLPLIPVIPWMIWRRRRRPLSGGWQVQAVGMTTGLSMLLYSAAVMETEVLRAILLFYLTPVWSVLLARVWLKEAIGPVRLSAIGLGLAGLWVMLGGLDGRQLEINPGDAMGLAAGMVWAVAATLMRKGDNAHSLDYAPAYLIWGGGLSLLMAFFWQPEFSMPDELGWTLLIYLPVIFALVFPSMLAGFWGAPRLNPGTVALLFMGEISIGMITAALWAGEPFGMREVTGIALISLSGVIEILPYHRLRRRRRPADG